MKPRPLQAGDRVSKAGRKGVVASADKFNPTGRSPLRFGILYGVYFDDAETAGCEHPGCGYEHRIIEYDLREELRLLPRRRKP